MKVLALDFDGVISDSAPESFAVALETYVALREDSIHVEAAQRLLAARDRSDLLGVIHAEPLYASFLELMPLGNRAEDFGVALAILERGAAVSAQGDYDREYRREPQSFLDAFHERFYQHRAAFASQRPEVWRSLLAPYPAFLEVLRRRHRDVVLAIATAKDRPSVARLLARYEVADLFEDRLVLDKETGKSKRAHLQVLADRTGQAFEEITFVDDKVNHLDAVADLGVRCALAAWGYNGRRERELARANGHLVCELGSVEVQLFG